MNDPESSAGVIRTVEERSAAMHEPDPAIRNDPPAYSEQLRKRSGAIRTHPLRFADRSGTIGQLTERSRSIHKPTARG